MELSKGQKKHRRRQLALERKNQRMSDLEISGKTKKQQLPEYTSFPSAKYIPAGQSKDAFGMPKFINKMACPNCGSQQRQEITIQTIEGPKKVLKCTKCKIKYRD